MVTSSRQVSFMIIKDVNDDEIDENDGSSPAQGKCDQHEEEKCRPNLSMRGCHKVDNSHKTCKHKYIYKFKYKYENRNLRCRK